MVRKKYKGKGPAKLAPRPPFPKRAAANSNFPRNGSDVATPRFSLQEEAQWASKHRSNAFDSAKKLRHMPIAFVSAGMLVGTLEEKLAPVAPAIPPSPKSSPLDTDDLARMTIRSPSPAASVSSASSDEVVVFRGRGHTPLTRPPLAASNAVQDAPSTDLDTSLPFRAAPPPSAEPNIATPAPEPAAASQADSDVESDANSVNDSAFSKRRGGRPIWEGSRVDWVSRSKSGIGWLPTKDRPDMDSFLRGEANPRDAAMDDYAQNVAENGLAEKMLASATFANREMDLEAGSHNDWDSAAGDEELGQHDQKDLDGWTPDQLRDLDGMSTSSADYERAIARIINKRDRVSGPQYLVVYEGSVADDARWLSEASLGTPSDLALIEKFEAELLARPQHTSSSSSSDDSEFDEDEQDLEADDEAIARFLQKQEEMEIDSDEADLYGAGDYMSFSRPNKSHQSRLGGGRRAEPSFPSASAMADALTMDPYGAFDIMDTNRPSLRALKKGRRGQPPPELEDLDMNEQLLSAWAADRTKKRIKKAEREELRKQGLLGRKGKAPDLSVKYKEGVEIMEVTEEIRTFMVSDMQTLSLPPMEAHQRAVIHQFIRNFGLNSKSRGDGVNRFTVLSKTSRMPPFDDDFFDSILASKKFKYRLTAGSRSIKSGTRKDRRTNGPARPNRSAGYRDGEVVGASAPELGSENIGRGMLEKMGWSKGMALGAHENKGILQPITHVMKMNKAGLK